MQTFIIILIVIIVLGGAFAYYGFKSPNNTAAQVASGAAASGGQVPVYAATQGSRAGQPISGPDLTLYNMYLADIKAGHKFLNNGNPFQGYGSATPLQEVYTDLIVSQTPVPTPPIH